MTVTLIKGTPAYPSDSVETLLSVCESRATAKEEMEKLEKSGNWKELKIEEWQVIKHYDWTPLQSPYSFRMPDDLTGGK